LPFSRYLIFQFHFLVWIHGHPRTCTEYKRLVSDESSGWSSNLVDYCESIVSAEFPTQIPLNCPSCVGDVEAKLVPVEIPSKYHRPPRNDPPPPDIAQCVKCDTKFTYEKLFKSVIDSMPDQADSLSEEAIHELMSSDRIIPVSSDENDIAGLQLTLVLQKAQNHRWGHCKSCFKKTTRVPV
jgi:hypothetical protein